jgi:hypothetical protein
MGRTLVSHGLGIHEERYSEGRACWSLEPEEVGMEWVIRNLFWIIVACIAGCVFLAVYLLRREGGKPPDRSGSRHGRP